MQMMECGAAHCLARLLRGVRQRLDIEEHVRLSGGLANRGGDAAELAIQSTERLLEDSQALEEARDFGAETFLRPEAHDLDRPRAINAIETADALLDERRIPGKIEQHEPPG